MMQLFRKFSNILVNNNTFLSTGYNHREFKWRIAAIYIHGVCIIAFGYGTINELQYKKIRVITQLLPTFRRS